MKNSTKIWLGILLVVILIIVAFRFTGNAVAEPGKYDDFAQCVSASGAKMYGAYWCPHCNNQKEMFGNSFHYIDYVECDARGDNANPQACQDAGIQGYPTWIFGNGEQAAGELSMQEIAFRTGCELPSA